MKKVGLIASLACLFTVGGVYATWTYATGGAAPVEIELSPQMAGKTETSEKGVIHVDTEDLSLVIDQSYDSLKPYKPVMILSGHINVWFTPNSFADASVKENGIPMRLTITQSEGWTYQPSRLVDGGSEAHTNIFSIVSPGTIDFTASPATYDELHPYQILAADIKDLIRLEVQEEIDTVDEWTYFQGQLVNDKKFTLTISERV